MLRPNMIDELSITILQKGEKKEKNLIQMRTDQTNQKAVCLLS